MADTLLADKYTRDPLLYSGFNRGQGAQAAYNWNGFRVGLGYTAANPLSTSSSRTSRPCGSCCSPGR